jgi:hypothetical protein
MSGGEPLATYGFLFFTRLAASDHQGPERRSKAGLFSTLDRN